MHKHITIDLIDFHSITVDDKKIIIKWSSFPDHFTRCSIYNLKEFYIWLMEIDEGGFTDPFWLIEEMDDVIKFLIQEFHAVHTDVYWAKEVNVLNKTIHKLQVKIRQLEKIISRITLEKSDLFEKLKKAIKINF